MGLIGADGDSPFDVLSVAKRPELKRMIAKTGHADERVIFSDVVTKINKRGREQKRVLLVTDKAVYNVKPNDFTKCKRRIAMEAIISVTVSLASDEFVIHVPDEYDYRFKSRRKGDVSMILSEHVKRLTGKKILIKHIGDTALQNVVVTKDHAKHQTRLDIMRRKQELAAEDHDSDHEENDAREQETTQLLPNTEKVSLDHFELLQVLGRGSFGKVLLVRKKNDKQIYAMKILKKSAIVAQNQVEHTMSERKVLQDIQHPFLVKLRFAFQTPQKLYFVLDYYKGGELFFHLKHKRFFRESEACLLVAEVGLGLACLHKHNVVYRDLKPENILMDGDGHVCITDFGLSKDIKPKEEAHTFCGTPEYLAPEVVRGGGHNQAVDWWSFGILLYELTVGIPPFYSQNVCDMYDKIQNGVVHFPATMSAECKDIITRLLNRNPHKRLGCGSSGFESIRMHPFFKEIDWELLMLKRIQPPYKPSVKDTDYDTSNFDEMFTKEPAVDSLVHESAIQNAGFSDFTFVGESNMPH